MLKSAKYLELGGTEQSAKLMGFGVLQTWVLLQTVESHQGASPRWVSVLHLWSEERRGHVVKS